MTLICALIVAVASSILALCSFVRSFQGGVGVSDFFIGFVADVAHFNFRISNVRVSTFLRSLISLSLSAIALQDFLA